MVGDGVPHDPTISQIRKALSLGAVRNVSIPLKNGFMGMDVDVRLLNAHIPTPKLQNIPISQLIGNLVPADASENSPKHGVKQ